MLPAGAMPHQPHHHVHSEMFFMREGTLELTVNGKTYPLVAGSVGFVRSSEEHGVEKVGTTPANYFAGGGGTGGGAAEGSDSIAQIGGATSDGLWGGPNW